ncbi:SCE4755 family polysaccharide monooxygenase-like protein [Nannocystis punicea]|uniref:MYXO-CTERM sorting domain-containing protein n=1 Tax=Nannocystis punicea TaxID=2995304 RepID=A0ABY7HH56_9BACT|nr:SCE4755 family polysaccharide monooxygenase-like protein [Nannocystis poenicansa]WAS98652.1 MYXO-CTERM sorting domain-containing protein [Nannocystis poenicansa]
MHRFAFPVLAFACVAVSATAAHAHIALSSPLPRHVEQKSGPCGVGPNDARGSEVATFQGGETILVRWTETVDHPGHFRISFDNEGHDDFGDPAGYDDFYSNPAVLVDEIADKNGPQQMYEQEVTLPLMSCDTCTLQLIQVMTDKPPYEVGTNDLYYQCADLVLMGAEETTGEETTGEATTGEETTGEATSTGEATTGVGTTTSGEPDSTTGGDPQPTTDGGDGTTADAGGTTAASGSDSEGTGNATDSMSDGEGGCGSCRTGGAGGSGLAAALLLLVTRRRRRG